MKVLGLVYSRKALMGTMGWTHAKIDRLIEKGMPVLERGGFNPDGSPRPWKFDTARCATFAAEQALRDEIERAEARRAGQYLKPLHPNDPRHKLATAQAERIDRANEREAAQVLAKDDAVEIVDAVFGMIRAHFGKLPRSIVAELAPLGAIGEKADKIERIIWREVNSTLSGLDAREIAEFEGESESEVETV